MSSLAEISSSNPAPGAERTLKLLLRLARAKTPEEAEATLSVRPELDLSADPWVKNPQPLDVSVLSVFTKLRTLKLDSQPIENPDALSTLKSVERLSVKLAWWGPLDPVTRMQNLTHLVLDENKIDNLGPLTAMTKLIALSVNKNSIRSLEPLKKFEMLEELSFAENDVASLAICSSFPGLKKLNAASNLIEDLAPLAKLRHLKVLDLSKNKINDLEPLRDLRELSDLNLRENSVRSLKPLKDLWNLNALGIGNNPVYADDIDDISRRIRLY